MLEEGINERGNYAFSNFDGRSVLFAKIDNDHWLQAAYSPENYPSWDVSSFYSTEEGLVDHITYTLGGWWINKTQCDLNTSDGCVVDAEDVVEDVAEHVMKTADKYGWNYKHPDLLQVAIQNSANMLSYLVTKKMIQEIEDKLLEE
jgi:hypothetical protein